MRQGDAHEARIAEGCVLAAILLAALAFRLTWIAYSDWRPLPDDDAFRYDFAAHALAQGKGYIFHLNGEPTAFWPPGYSLILSSVYTVFGYGLAGAQALNVVLALASVWLVYLIGRRLLGVPAALAAAAIVACFPSLVFFTNMTLSEVTFTWLTLLAVYLVVRDAQRVSGRWLALAAAGVVLGLASLTRGQALLLPLAFIPFWLRSGLSRAVVTRKLALLALGMAILVGAWTVRNTIQMHAPVLISTSSGIDFWVGHHAAANGTDGISHRYIPSHDYPELSGPEREARISNDAFRDGLSYAFTHPRREVELTFKKLYWLYYRDDEAVLWSEAHYDRPFLQRDVRQRLFDLSNRYYYAVLALCALGIAGPFSARAASRSLLVALLAYWTLVHLAFFADPRFHAPALPVMALLAGGAVQKAAAGLSRWRHNHKRATPAT